MKLTIVFVGLFLVATCVFDPKRMKRVAYNEKHFFFRGNLPVDGNTFQYDQLRAAVDQATNTTNYRLVVISLLNQLTAKQTRNKFVEEKFFHLKRRKDGVLIELKNFFIIGAFWSPEQVPQWLRNWYVKYYNYLVIDQINGVLEQIRKNMNSPIKTIVYMHCSAGLDRVGYVSGAFKMKFMNESFKSVMEENLEILREFRGHMHFNTYNGLQWFCLSLGRSEEECLIHISSDQQAELRGLSS